MEAMRLTGPALLVTKEDKKVRLFQLKGFELLLLFEFVFNCSDNCYHTLIIVTIQWKYNETKQVFGVIPDFGSTVEDWTVEEEPIEE